MKLSVSVNGQDQRRLTERVEQLIRARVANNTQPAAEHSTQPLPTSAPTQRQPRSDRRR